MAQQRAWVAYTARDQQIAAQMPSELRSVWEQYGIALVKIPDGSFYMGSNEGDSNEQPEHTVHLDEFWIGLSEVTNAQYAMCVAAGACQPSANAADGELNDARQPVVGVSWHDAAAYCAWTGLRLPTEAEWEKAARGTDGRSYPWGNEAPSCDLANYRQCVGRPAQVGSYPDGANPYGALDMAGNVEEWVVDWYQSDYYAQSPAANPAGPESGDYRVLRGGSWLGNQNFVRAAHRNGYPPGSLYVDLGFRCARSP